MSGHIVVTAYPFPWGHRVLLLEPVPALSQSEGLDTSPAHHRRALTDEQCGVRPCPEPGFEPVTFRSLADLLYPLSYSHPGTENHFINLPFTFFLKQSGEAIKAQSCN